MTKLIPTHETAPLFLYNPIKLATYSYEHSLSAYYIARMTQDLQPWLRWASRIPMVALTNIICQEGHRFCEPARLYELLIVCPSVLLWFRASSQHQVAFFIFVIIVPLWQTSCLLRTVQFIQLKADRPHPRDWSQTHRQIPLTDYGPTWNLRVSVNGLTDGQPDGRTDATKCIISLLR